MTSLESIRLALVKLGCVRDPEILDGFELWVSPRGFVFTVHTDGLQSGHVLVTDVADRVWLLNWRALPPVMVMGAAQDAMECHGLVHANK